MTIKGTPDRELLTRLLTGLESAAAMFEAERRLSVDRDKAQTQLEDSVKNLLSIIATGYQGKEPVLVQLGQLKQAVTGLENSLGQVSDSLKRYKTEVADDLRGVIDGFKDALKVCKDTSEDHETRIRTMETWRNLWSGGRIAAISVLTLILSLGAVIASFWRVLK